MRFLARQFLLAALALVAITAGAEERVTYLVPNAQGSPVAAMDEQGNVIWRESYAPYGARLTKPAGNDAKTAYTGKPQDPDTQLVYMGARWYDPDAARFTGIDPQGFKEDNVQSFGRYLYANNTPYVLVDPNGELPALPVLAVAIAKEAGAATWEATTGLPAVFSYKSMGKTAINNIEEFRSYVLKALAADVSTKRNEAVVYSGKGARKKAEEFAAMHNKKTIEMTPGGKEMDQENLYGIMSPLTKPQADIVWTITSGRYAQGASGTVVGILNNPRKTSVFEIVEYPNLLRNKAVDNVVTGGR